MAEKQESAGTSGVRWWVQCNKCLKWRRGYRSRHFAEKFICSDLSGSSCRTPVEEAAKNGRPKDADLEVDEDDPFDPSPTRNGKQKIADDGKRHKKGLGKGKKMNPVCANCGQRTERSAAGKERHYLMSPGCRPVEETTPEVVSRLVLDLSDRLPYMAVLRKDMRMWENFTQRTKSCSTMEQAAKELLWLFKQLKPVVFDPEWNQRSAQSFRDDCENCRTPEQAIDLLRRMELEAIDWQRVYELWETERAEAAEAEPPKKKARAENGSDRKAQKRRRQAAQGEGRERSQDTSEEKEDKSTKGWIAELEGASGVKPEEQDDADGGEDAAKGREGDADEEMNEQEEAEEEEEEQEEEDDEQEEEEEEGDEEEGEDGVEERNAASGEEDSGEEEAGEDAVYTVGTLVEVQLDDDEQALAIVSRVPSGSDDKHQVTFLDDKQQIALEDTLMLELPNEFVKVLLPCEAVPGLPAGWIPVPDGDGEQRRFVGPQGQLCRTLEEVRKSSQRNV